MKILVTGGAGFIGSHVADRYIELGHNVVIVDNLSTGNEDFINPKARFYKVDIMNDGIRDIFQKERPDIVNHHAAQIDIRRSVEEPVFDAQVNIIGSLNIIKNCLDFGIRKFIFASTGGAIYGEPEYLPTAETHRVQPISPYGIAKLAIENYLYAMNPAPSRLSENCHCEEGALLPTKQSPTGLLRSRRSLAMTGGVFGQPRKGGVNLDYTILRYANVYGPRQNPLGEAGVCAIFLGRMQKGEPCILYGYGEPIRDYVYVGDIVEANVLVLTNGSRGIYNLGTGIGTSVKEVFQILKELAGYNKEPEYKPLRPGELQKIYLDCTKAKKELGWVARIPLREGLSRIGIKVYR